MTWLDDEQLEIMHATEGGYYYAEIEGVDLTYDDGTRADSVHLYVGREGHLVHEAQPVALIEIDGEDRTRRGIQRKCWRLCISAWRPICRTMILSCGVIEATGFGAIARSKCLRMPCRSTILTPKSQAD